VTARTEQSRHANTLFNTGQRIVGSFGIGLLAAVGARAVLALPTVRNTALDRG
jgi:hypothetical protein